MFTVVAFAFSVICVFILVALVEGVRRFGREYDRTLVRQARKRDSASGSLTKTNDLYGPLYFLARPVLDIPLGPPSRELSSPSAYGFEPTHKQQLIRALIFTVQFGAAFIIMLLVMQSK